MSRPGAAGLLDVGVRRQGRGTNGANAPRERTLVIVGRSDGSPRLSAPNNANWYGFGTDIRNGFQFVYEPLFTLNHLTGEHIPWLTERYQCNDDFTSVRVFIRKGVKWNDGEDFDAEDVGKAPAVMGLEALDRMLDHQLRHDPEQPVERRCDRADLPGARRIGDLQDAWAPGYRMLDILALLGKGHVHIGPSGTAAAAKLMNNAIGAVTLCATAEALALARDLEIDQAAFV